MQKSVIISLKNEQATQQLAASLARYAVCGDFIRLEGTLGMGKTTFARAFVRALAGDENLAVPSPTFNLMQVYDETRLPVAHVDAYRMADAQELDILDLDSYFEHGVVLMEWAGNVEDALPEFTPPKRHIMESEVGDKLTLTLSETGEGERQAVLEASGTWLMRLPLIIPNLSRLQTAVERDTFMQSLNKPFTPLVATSTDCSLRTYYRTEVEGEKRMLMDAPPPMEDTASFAYMDKFLQSVGVRTPHIYASNHEKGYLLLEDLGCQPLSVVCQDESMQEKWLTKAVDLLIHLANSALPDVWHYDPQTPWQEAKRFTDWYLPLLTGHATHVADRAAFKQAWLDAWPVLQKMPQTTCHMDLHVDNLLALENGELAVIDFQDARVGPICLDIATLLEDRFPASDALKEKLIDRFLAGLTTPVLKEDFMAGYNLCIAHRFFKITGLLPRLVHRDLRTGIPDRMPQVWQTLNKALTHPVCASIRQLTEQFTQRKGVAS